MKNILLVEDEEMLVNVLATLLEDEGYKVRKSTSAEEALDSIGAFKPDLIISDVKLPEKDGFTMLKQLKGDTSVSSIPFICLTALDDNQSAQRAKTLGAAAYMTKPFDVDDLVKVIRQVIP